MLKCRFAPVTKCVVLRCSLPLQNTRCSFHRHFTGSPDLSPEGSCFRNQTQCVVNYPLALHESVLLKGLWTRRALDGIGFCLCKMVQINFTISSHELQKVVPEHAVVQCVYFKKTSRRVEVSSGKNEERLIIES